MTQKTGMVKTIIFGTLALATFNYAIHKVCLPTEQRRNIFYSQFLPAGAIKSLSAKPLVQLDNEVKQIDARLAITSQMRERDSLKAEKWFRQNFIMFKMYDSPPEGGNGKLMK